MPRYFVRSDWVGPLYVSCDDPSAITGTHHCACGLEVRYRDGIGWYHFVWAGSAMDPGDLELTICKACGEEGHDRPASHAIHAELMHTAQVAR